MNNQSSESNNVFLALNDIAVEDIKSYISDNLDDFDTPFGEYHSKMNAAANDDTFKPSSFPSATDAFGAPEDEDEDVPF